MDNNGKETVDLWDSTTRKHLWQRKYRSAESVFGDFNQAVRAYKKASEWSASANTWLRNRVEETQNLIGEVG